MSILYTWGTPICPKTFTNSSFPSIYKVQFDEQITLLSCGEGHALLKTCDNKLYGLGRNKEGQLGVDRQQKHFYSITPIITNTEIISISCGWNHTLLLDCMGEVYSAGEKLQHGFNSVLKGAQQISAGMDHSLARCGSKVFGWGSSKEGQLGLPLMRVYAHPKELNVYPTTRIFAGEKYSFFITVKGVYGTGINSHFQLGIGTDKNAYIPKKINFDHAQICNVIGGNYCVAQAEDRSYYLWGSGVFGVYRFPTKLPFLQGCRLMAVGVDFGLLQREDGSVQVWGSNKNGELSLEGEGMANVVEAPNLTILGLDAIECGGNFMIGYHSLESGGIWQQINKEQSLSSRKMGWESNSKLFQMKSRHQNDIGHISHILQMGGKMGGKMGENRGDFQDTRKRITYDESADEQPSESKQDELEKENSRLRGEVREKTIMMENIRGEYLQLLNMVEDNQFLSSILHLNHPSLFGKQPPPQHKAEVDPFSLKLQRLKSLLLSTQQS